LSQQETGLISRSDRLWAASGQSALESSRILVISGSATSTSILKNLVLPGIGHFTILDPEKVTPEDAGNNFFLEGPSSIGKSRAEEAVRLLCELNEGVEGKADVRSLEEVLEKDKEWLSDFTIVIAHNLEAVLLDQLASFLWEDSSNPSLVIVRSAGFLAEVYIQYHEHAGMCVVY
jgi:amyloid beta precursor protein binding protein 1